MSTPSQSLREIFLAAIEKTDSCQREAFLSQACGDDLDLLRHVEALLKVHDEPDSLLDQERINAPVDMTIVSAAPAPRRPSC
jgi:eukaryotic-like serine/threonine-protein kinase